MEKSGPKKPLKHPTTGNYCKSKNALRIYSTVSRQVLYIVVLVLSCTSYVYKNTQ